MSETIIEKNEENFKEYMLEIADKIADFRSELQDDIETTDFSYSSSLIMGRIQKMDFNSSSLPTYLDYSWRLSELRKLRDMLIRNKSDLLKAMMKDYAMSGPEAEMFEFNAVLTDLENAIKNLTSWAETPLDITADDFAGGEHIISQVFKSFKAVFGIGNDLRIFNQPYGVVLIIGSKRPDLSTLLKPLISSIAAGNCSVIKPDVRSISGETNRLMKDLLKDTLDPRRSMIMEGEINYSELITKDNFDMIFLRKRTANEGIINLCGQRGVPVKIHSPGWNVGIVARSANIKEAAEMLVHNKFYKSGQNNDNLDVIYVHEAIYQAFLIEAKNALYKFYTQAGDQNMTYGRIVNDSDFKRLLNYLDKSDHQGEYETSIYHNAEISKINPILIKNPTPDSTIMKEKIFGPILPINTFKNVVDVAPLVNKQKYVENVYYFGMNTYLHEDIKHIFRYQNLFLNCTNLPFHLTDYVPDFGRDATLNSNLHGIYGFHAFSRQKLFFNDRNGKGLLKKNFLNGKFKYGLHNSGLSKFLTRYRAKTVATGVAIGFLLEKYVL